MLINLLSRILILIHYTARSFGSKRYDLYNHISINSNISIIIKILIPFLICVTICLAIIFHNAPSNKSRSLYEQVKESLQVGTFNAGITPI